MAPTPGVTVVQMKAAWVRDPAVPAGRPAPGTYGCPTCRAKIGPVDFGVIPDPCGNCGTRLDAHGWVWPSPAF